MYSAVFFICFPGFVYVQFSAFSLFFLFLSRNLHFLHFQIERNKKLGEGAFGEVWEGTLNLGVFRGYIPVAIKTLHSGNISTDERIKFLREANLMLKLNHPNIIKFYGVATLKDPIMIVMEFASGGSLLARVQNIKQPVKSFEVYI